tara:strand:- start:1599 stop:1904 length:306 start_codon:yes stop_codon:yes gene_type:complete
MSSPKCWWRYNNNGGRYKTCEINQYKKGVGKAPKEVDRLTPEQFVEKIGIDYSAMKKPQRNEYHRLDMAERRKEERKEVSKIVEQRRKARKRKQNKKKPIS